MAIAKITIVRSFFVALLIDNLDLRITAAVFNGLCHRSHISPSDKIGLFAPEPSRIKNNLFWDNPATGLAFSTWPDRFLANGTLNFAVPSLMRGIRPISRKSIWPENSAALSHLSASTNAARDDWMSWNSLKLPKS
jgi:hypothetical protein